jgi:hypothetical protein
MARKPTRIEINHILGAFIKYLEQKDDIHYLGKSIQRVREVLEISDIAAFDKGDGIAMYVVVWASGGSLMTQLWENSKGMSVLYNATEKRITFPD